MITEKPKAICDGCKKKKVLKKVRLLKRNGDYTTVGLCNRCIKEVGVK